MKPFNMTQPETAPGWRNLSRVGGIAALLAGALFRRNLGVEIALFSPIHPPDSTEAWFGLLHTRRLLGLAYLGIFDVLNAILVGLMLLALFAALRRVAPSLAACAGLLGLLGIAVLITSNTALSMLSLSDQFAAETDEAQRSILLAAGQALQALNRFHSQSAHPGSGGYLSLLLIAVSCLLFSLGLLRCRIFGKAAGILGVLAAIADLLYCIAFPFTPALLSRRLAVTFIPAGGLLWMAWHLWVGWKLFMPGKLSIHDRVQVGST